MEATLGSLIRAERTALGLSTREMARLAGLSYPTISRIENGHEQPRWDTVKKLAAVLGTSFTSSDDLDRVPALATLRDAWSADPSGEAQPDWTRFRAFVDQLRLRPECTAACIVPEPASSGSSLIDNLLAAIAEKLADDVGIRRPKWTAQRPPLITAWSAAATPSKHARDVAATPRQFAERNITLPASALWRDRTMSLS